MIDDKDVEFIQNIQSSKLDNICKRLRTETSYRGLIASKIAHLTGGPLTTCLKCLIEEIKKIQSLKIEIIMERNSVVCKLKNGVLLHLKDDFSNYYSNANITDEIARKLLNEQPDLVSKFSVLPPKEVKADVKSDNSSESAKKTKPKSNK